MKYKPFLAYLTETYGDHLAASAVTPDQVLAQLEPIWDQDGIEFVYEGDSFISFNRAEGSIEDIYVDPADRRLGVGTRLEEQVCDILRADGHTRVYGFIEFANQNKLPIAMALQNRGYVHTSSDESRMIFIKELK
jgi:GNAT superfamily N-acetyltransferase